MKSSLGLFLAFLWISNPDSQKNNFVDLTRPPITHNQTEGHDRRDVTDGCEKADGGGIADGWVKPDGGLPRDILVQVLSVKNAKPALGSELEATVQLRNADARPIQIPWSTEQRIIRDGQKSDDLHWEAGTFEFMLRDGKNNHVRLKSETGWLYSSKFSDGSRLTIKPGESITAFVRLKIEDEYAIEPFRLKEGKWQLSAEWLHIGRELHVKNCGVWSAYFHYDGYYRQRSPGVTIQVMASNSLENK